MGLITERLPKPQYGNVMRRNKSLPPEHMEKLPEIAAKAEKKETMIEKMNKAYESANK